MYRDLVSQEDWNFEREVYRTLRADVTHNVEAIDAVPWTSLQAVDGPASDAPLLLRGLLSTDPRIVEFSAHLVWDYLCHQGSVYQASPFALPILLGIAVQSTGSETLECLRLLAQLADGQSMRPELTDEARQRQGPTDVELSIRRWFLRNLSDLGNLLDSPSPAVRCSAADILSRFPESAHVILPRLESAYEREQDSNGKAELRRAIEVMRSGGETYPTG